MALRYFEISTENSKLAHGFKIKVVHKVNQILETTFLKEGGETASTEIALKYMPSVV
jgi:hypothetical protein